MTDIRHPELLIVIPARLESSRLPKKLLLDLHGKPLLYWTVKRVMRAKLADVVVATDSARILSMCKVFGFPVKMTSQGCLNGTERVFEVASDMKSDYRLFMNVQGDEPLLNIEILGAMLETIGLNDHSFKTAVSEISESTTNNVAEVKVAMSRGQRIRYASRSPIPFGRDATLKLYKIHGVYLYPYSILEEFMNSLEGPLEKVEKVEQLRCIENDIPLYGVITPSTPNSVDTKVDYEMYVNLDSEVFI